MTKPTGVGRGGKRPGAGRKPNPEWLNLWWTAFRCGDLHMMRRADAMEREWRAAEAAKSAPTMFGRATIKLRGSSRLCATSAEAAAAALRERTRRARKQRSYRIRKARGLAVVSLVYAPDEVIAALIKTRRLAAADALDKGAVDAAIQLVVADFGKRW